MDTQYTDFETDSPADDGALLDRAAVAALRADVGLERLAPVMTAFADELERRRPVLDSAIVAGDVAAAGRETHSIKGSALTFGALALGAAARRCNDAYRNSDARATLAAAREVVALMAPTRAAVLGLVARMAEVKAT